MIKKEYKLVPILGSRKELVPRHLVQKRDTHQFGTIHPGSLRGKQARRNLRDNFDPVSLYVVDPKATLESHERGILTLKDGSKILAVSHDYLSVDVVMEEKVVLFQGELFDCWVDPPYLGEQHEQLPYFKFRSMTTRNLQLVLEGGGKIWIEMEDDDAKAAMVLMLTGAAISATDLRAIKMRLHDGKAIIHLTN